MPEVWVIGMLFAIGFVSMTTAWLIQKASKNSNIVDICWTFGIGTGIVFLYYNNPPIHLSGMVVFILGIIWSLRLGIHLLLNRLIFNNTEDSRYRNLREDYGDQYNGFLLWFVWFQAILIPIFCIPFVITGPNDQSTTLLLSIGISVAIVSIIGSHLADHQLERWKKDKDNAGKTCKVGLWRYSRHPNYFFEWLYWCSYPIICWPFTHGYLALIVPIIELFLLLKVTGIPYTERCSLKNRSDYARYQQTTSPFFPWFPRKES